MSKICQVTKKKSMLGQNRSHAMNATKRKFSLNIQYHKFWLPKEKKRIKIRISAKGLRMINKFGIEKIYKKYII
ncbi:50S ribosomal protein L28 [Buchnera aphidicola]|uniref:Large ribosomal subunit protein bL28 n=1 Tax=Buchnera aphidicola (Cinara cf. splendens/pseudotsugae 3390) TaxID=2518980 RepID=A0A451CX11_9GAMM|nr:50S ribosomal protein L28 [Buchnera aphidicola]VFP77628.1 50S ribosomal protein L28 [Buchnera aphidicola (Cinara cf. splendens/pseudotsugae 3390)]